MARKITEDCINCAACEPECPNEAITQGDTALQHRRRQVRRVQDAKPEVKCVTICPVADTAIVMA